jgi:multidrug resistance efflux pump
MDSPEARASDLNLTDRLENATHELQRLEELVKSGELDQRVLSEFRNAVDHIRTTAWAVQKWVGLAEQSGGDPFSVLPVMSAERVRRATQISNDLCLDLQCADVGLDTKGIVDLYNAVGDLHRRLASLLGRST